MAKNHAPAPPPSEDLAEVERALSILEGRHPDQVRVERETQETVRARRLAQESAALAVLASRTRRIVRWVAATSVPLLVIGAAVWWVNRWSARVGAVDALTAPLVAAYLTHGFHDEERSTLRARDRLEQDTSAGKCFVAVAASASGDDRLEVERGGTTIGGRGSIAWCTCQAEHIRITALARGREGGVGLAQIEARLVGGALAMPFVVPRPDTIASPGECAADQLDAWLAGQSSTEPATIAWLDEDARARGLHTDRLGDGAPTPTVLQVVAAVEPTLPFGVVARGSPFCALAVSDDDDDLLTLRLTGDARPISKTKGPIGWCDARGSTASVWREGKGRVFVLAAPAERIGGTLGLREAAARAGFIDLTTWVAEGDLGWNAASVLRASGVGSADITISGAAVPAAKLVAGSVGRLVPDARDPATWRCASLLVADASDAVCSQAVAWPWRAPGRVGVAGIAQGTLPFWMRVYAPAAGNDVLKSELGLVTLSRRLATLGFETTIDGVTDLAGGVDIVGRSGDAVIVAVGLLGEPPWVAPFTDQKTSWAIEGEPRFVPITPGAHVRLTSGAWSHVAPSMRQAVVFRKGSTR